MYIKSCLAALILFCSLTGLSQTAKECTGDCCQKEKSESKPKEVKSMETTIKNKVIACKLTSPELRERKEKVLAVLKLKILGKQELKDGYKYKFEGSDQVIDELITFIKTERICCDFFAFNFSIADDIVWLSITGPEGAKEFIKAEMDL
jgi:hypothetical protein